MSLALITFSPEGVRLITRLAAGLGRGDLYVHRDAPVPAGATPFESVMTLTEQIFGRYRGLIYAAPCGVVVRAIAPHLGHKTADPAIVVTDVLGRHAVSLLSGHEGGANDLALHVANLIGAEPVITTTSEARRTVIVGVGCRRGAEAGVLEAAIREALARAAIDLNEVRMIASADVKADEPGLAAAAQALGLPLRFIASDEIRSCMREFTHSSFVEEKVGVPAVAEPAALLAGRRTRLIQPRLIINSISLALVREDSTS